MQVASLFDMKVWRMYVYEYNIVNVSIPVVYTVCMFVWVSLLYIYSCDRCGAVSVNVYVCLYPPFCLLVLHLPAVMLKSYRVIAHKQKHLTSMVQLYRNWQHPPCQGVYC